MQRKEATSVATEIAYYASLEVIHGRPADLAKTLRFKKPSVPPPIPRRKPTGTPPPIPQHDPVTTKFERCEDDATVPFLKESAPYELIDIQDGPAEVASAEPVEVVDIDLASMELIAASDLLAGDTIRSAGPIFEPSPHNNMRLIWIVIVLVAAFSIGIALAYLA